MTRKDYQLIADVLHAVMVEYVSPYETDYNKLPHEMIGRIQTEFEDKLKADNPNFDSVRFSDAIWLPRLKEVTEYKLPNYEP